MDTNIESIERKLLKTRLTEWTQEARNSRLSNGLGARYGELIALAAQSVEQMPEAMENHLINLYFVKNEESGLHPVAMELAQVEESLQPYAKSLWRWGAEKTSYRCPSLEDAILANELMTQLPPKANRAALQNALETASIMPPHADAVDYAASIAHAIAKIKPFSDRNETTASLLMMGCLSANGCALSLAEGDYDALLGLVYDEPLTGWLRPKVSKNAPNEGTFSDALKSAATIHREPLSRAWVQRQTSGSSSLLPALRDTTTLQPMPGISASLRYLSLQDMIWINSECVGRAQPYAYDALEECSYYQYSYKQSMDLPRQAARFLMGFLKYKPFASGNLKTTLIAVLAFLEINGYEVELPPSQAAEWLLSVKHREKHPLSAIQQISHRAAPGSLPSPLRELTHHLMHVYHEALHQLEDDNQ